MNNSENSSVEIVLVDSLLVTENEKKLFDLLKSWELDCVFAQLKEAGVGINELEFINESHIAEIFQGYQLIGVKAKFQAKWKQWHSKEFCAINDDTCSDVLSWVNKLPASPSSALSVDRLNNSEVDIRNILQQTVRGKLVLEYFDANKNLKPSHQQLLCNCLIDSLTTKKDKLSTEDLRQLSAKIAETFPSEDPKTYYTARSKINRHASGKLHDRYFNNRNRFKRKTSQASSSSKCNLDNLPEVDETLSQGIKAWLRYNDSPLEELLTKWKQSYSCRRTLILEQNESLINIVSEWPLYKHGSLGPNLISIDFERLHPDRGNCIFQNWNNFAETIVSHYKESVRDKQSLDLLSALDGDISENSRDCIILMLLNAVILPTSRTSQEDGNKKKKKITIKDAVDSLVLHMESINLLQTNLEHIRENFYKNKRTLQPLIIVVGQSLNNLEEYYVYIDDIKFKCSSFLSALDTYFKTFHVFNVEYPEFCRGAWLFIQRYFFDVICSNEKPYPQVSGLISYLKNKN